VIVKRTTINIGKVANIKTAKNPKISVCTYCMKRFEQAKVSIPHLLSQIGPDDEIVFVDYSCPEKSGSWAKSLSNRHLKTISVTGRSWWNPAHAHNCAAKASIGNILVFMDIDNIFPDGLLGRVRTMSKRSFYAFLPGDNLSGFCCIWKEDFLQINGYEEALAGWGYEDTSLYRALDLAGIKRIDITDVKPQVLNPDKQTRVLEPTEGDPWQQNWAITDILRQRHPYKNNIHRDWGLGWQRL
jgi:glycosyltransferase involved in cell wall biosynthesis